jgi:hypothetical protein
MSTTGGFEFGDPGSGTDTGGFEFGDPGSSAVGNTGSDYMDFGSGDVPFGSTTDYGLKSLTDQLSGPGFTNFLKSLGGLFSGTTAGKAGQFAAFGGIAALLNKMMGDQQQKPVGYQGGIPKFNYERTQTPLAEQRPTTTGPDGKVIPYRPGQGGISYFTPGAFRYAGYEPKTAQEFVTVPATVGGGSGGGSGSTGEPPINMADYIYTGDPINFGTGKTMAAEEMPKFAASGGYMPGGIAMLSKGRYLKGNGDGVSDSIPARFAGSGQEARLADGEFVIPARVVSELGNGSSDAGARKLYAMLDRVEAQARKAKRGKPSGADRELKKLA